MRRILPFAIAMSCAFAAIAAPSFNERLEKGHARLENGDTEGAMTEYRDLQVDHPESLELYYNMGRAQYQAGMQEIELKAAEDATKSFTDARASFEKALVAPDPELRRDAAFNQANCTTQLAKQLIAGQKYEESLEAFKSAVSQYEELAKKYPGYTPAKTNLDHVRYLLKSLMQNPPPPQEQQQNQQGDKKDQQKDQQQNQDQNQQQPQEEQNKKEEEQNKDQQKQEEQQQEQQQQAQQAQENKDQNQDQSQENAEEQKPEQQQNVEALLQSLEDTDQREQREVRNDRSELGMSKEWW